MTTVTFLIFPQFTLLDLFGPYEILARTPGVTARIVAEHREPVVSDLGVTFLPDATLASSPRPDMLVVPGGPGINAVLTNDVMLDYISTASKQARYVTSVCTGALALGAAGLLQGRRATTHWLSMDHLTRFGAIPTSERVVCDDPIYTSAGVSAGMDLALVLAERLAGVQAAEGIQLFLEYDPMPHLNAGSPEKAAPEIRQAVQARMTAATQERGRCVEQAARRLNHLSVL